MKKIAFVLFTVLTLASALPTLIDVDEAMIGINAGFGNITDTDNMTQCAGSYVILFPDLEIFMINLLTNWDAAYDWADGFFIFSGLKNDMNSWVNDCLGVYEAYLHYFAQAIQAYNLDREGFISTVEANFEANKVEIIGISIDALGELNSHNGQEAGVNISSILKILLKNWL